MNKTLDLASLWPDFGKLWVFIKKTIENGNINITALESDVVSALVVTIIFIVAIIFFSIVIRDYIRARFRVSKLNKLLKDLTPENLDQKRRSLKEDSRKLGHVGNLWGEFDETLVETGAEGKLYNTIDSSHFFNNHTLAPFLTENRLLAAVPGFLTAIGVIGTFAGLSMGLHGISFDGDFDAQQNDIKRVINGASVAFLTSVWGVLTSVVFNFLEKILEQGIKKHISKLQNRIDFLFPKISPAQSLVNIDDSSSRSQDALDGLAERIGEQLQTGIKEVMKPAMDSLVGASQQLADRQAEGATDAFSQLVTQFMEKMTEGGESQRKLMADTTSDFKSSITDMHAQMNTLIEQLSGFSETMSASVNQNIEASRESTSRNENLAKEVKALTEKLSNVMGGLESCSEHMFKASDNIKQASSEVSSATLVLEKEITNGIDAVKALSTENSSMMKNTEQIIEQVGVLKDKLEGASTQVIEASKTVANTFDNLKERQTEFLENQKDTLEQYETVMETKFEELTQGASNFLKNYTEMVEEHTNDRLGKWNEQTDAFCRQMVNTVRSLQDLISELEDQ